MFGKDILGTLDSYVDSAFKFAGEVDSAFDSMVSGLSAGFISIDKILGMVPGNMLPADVRRYLDKAEGYLSSASSIKNDIFNSYLYNTQELYELFQNKDGSYSEDIHRIPDKPTCIFDGWETAQQNFWEVRILSNDINSLPKYFAVLPAIDCSLCMGEVDINNTPVCNNNIFTANRVSSGTSFTITFLDDDTHSVMKFLRSWILSLSPRPGVIYPAEIVALDMEFKKYNRRFELMFNRKLKVLPDGELSMNFSAVSDDDVQTPFTFKIIGEEFG